MRIVALGASNLTRGLRSVLSIARRAWGPGLEVLAALGHGRSYGAESRFLLRALPGILQCGIWRTLEQLPPQPTRALVTDVGNDILYGYSVSQVLAWLEECVVRLRTRTGDVVVADLPLARIQRLSAAGFLFFRSLFVPNCRLSRVNVIDRAEQVAAGLGSIAAARQLRFVRLQPEWYGLDPIHIRRRRRGEAWREILGVEATPRLPRGESWSEAARLSLMRPERQRICGITRYTPQPGRPLPGGATVRLY